MSKHYQPSSWSQLACGVGMLDALGLIGLIYLSNEIGFGKAVAAVILGTLIAAWLIIGVVLVVRGLSKM